MRTGAVERPQVAGSSLSDTRPVLVATRGALEELLIAVALVAHLAVVVLLRHFPYQDVSNHLARYTLIERAWAGEAPPWVAVHVAPTAYVALDLLGAWLVRAVGPLATGRVLAAVAVLAPPLGMYALLRAASPAQRGWALVGVLLSFSAYFLSGFLNYVIGIGAAFAWLAAWWPRRHTARAAARLALAFGLAALFVLHLSAPLVALVVVGVECLWAARTAHAGGRAALVAALRPRAATLLACAAALGTVWAASTAIAAHNFAPTAAALVTIAQTPAVVFRTPASKALALATPFYAWSPAQLAVMLGTYLAALAALLRVGGRAVLSHPLAVAGLALFGVYLVWPLAIPPVWAVDARWLLPAYLLPFCGAGARAPRPTARALAALTALVVLHAGVVWWYGRRLDRDLAGFDRALARVPAGARLLPLVTRARRHGVRITPYRHYAMWYVINYGGRVPGLFTADGMFDGDLPYPHMAHVREYDRLYYPNERWGDTLFTALPWDRIRRDFDYVLQAGDDDPRVRARVAPYARALFREGDVTVYAVHPPGAASAAARLPDRAGSAR